MPPAEADILRDRKFLTDTLWNYGSLGIVALVGVALNILIVLWLGADGLGVFNQIYAIFAVSGQIVVLGLNDSAQKHASEFANNPQEQQSLGVAAVVVAAGLGFSAAVLLVLFSGAIGQLVQSQDVGRGVLFVAPGLCFFSINKVLMGILNGKRRMVAFAVGQSLRAFCILLVGSFIVVRRGTSSELGLSFTFAEIVLFFSLIAFIRPLDYKGIQLAQVQRWLPRHIAFGGKALVHGFLSEAFLRVDIIMLGVFMADREVGIYSFAAMFVEGVYQVPMVIRTIVNPILVRFLLVKDRLGLASFSRRIAMLSFAATVMVAAPITLVYPYIGSFFSGEVIQASYGILVILMASLSLYAVFIPFDYILLDAGWPGLQSVFMTINAMINVVLNFALIPPFGLYGACIATAISFILSCVNLNCFAARVLGLRGGILFADKV